MARVVSTVRLAVSWRMILSRVVTPRDFPGFPQRTSSEGRNPVTSAPLLPHAHRVAGLRPFSFFLDGQIGTANGETIAAAAYSWQRRAIEQAAATKPLSEKLQEANAGTQPEGHAPAAI
jgi:hypothetical protein